MKLSRVLLVGLLYAAMFVCMFLPAIVRRIFHFVMGHDAGWMGLGAGLMQFVFAAALILEKPKPGQIGKGLMVLGAAGSGAGIIFFSLYDFFPAMSKMFDFIPLGWILVVFLFFAVIGVVGIRRYFRKEAESAEQVHEPKHDGAGAEPNHNG